MFGDSVDITRGKVHVELHSREKSITGRVSYGPFTVVYLSRPSKVGFHGLMLLLEHEVPNAKPFIEEVGAEEVLSVLRPITRLCLELEV